MASQEMIVRVVLVGMGATVVMDAWTMALRRLGVPVLDYALVGRWVGHWRHGRFAHADIRQALAVRGEAALGWGLHYATGVLFAGLLAGFAGQAWLRAPSPGPALAVGVATVLLPWFVMQPALGAGVASSRTPTPVRNCLRSVVTHAVFGLGMYLAAAAIVWAWP
ncbi:DUF2938 domain-containing protein [Bordetella bronchiseptica]|uniref:DUF2938 domain-containing protein n=1 Tax=Bordetella bronchiseptica TaxID=518 RepID=UPI00081C9A5D|nr:DUF2938 domain-containing protein [Bordetella bronchiseptica]AOB27244.1 hypothetical protein BBB44_13830 [Bordetella bronchiseptica]AZW44553.1 DUF2938 domain-containing protein [Bordetella bronchiseptica]